jgi:hypothetical protein
MISEDNEFLDSCEDDLPVRLTALGVIMSSIDFKDTLVE